MALKRYIALVIGNSQYDSPYMEILQIPQMMQMPWELYYKN